MVLAFAKIAILYIATRIEYDVRWYIITDRSLLIREGVWVLREITLTFANAQNVRVTQGPLQRWFGFSNIQIDTAGGGGKTEEGGTVPHHAVLRGIKNPEELRDLILELLRRHRTTGIGDPDEHHHHGQPELASGRSKALLAEILEEAKELKERCRTRRSTGRVTCRKLAWTRKANTQRSPCSEPSRPLHFVPRPIPFPLPIFAHYDDSSCNQQPA